MVVVWGVEIAGKFPGKVKLGMYGDSALGDGRRMDGVEVVGVGKLEYMAAEATADWFC